MGLAPTQEPSAASLPHPGQHRGSGIGLEQSGEQRQARQPFASARQRLEPDLRVHHFTL
jgi:hypothetical protein